MIPKNLLCLLLLPGFAAASTTSATFTDTWNVSTAIPDNDPVGFSDTRVISTDVTEITDVTVELTTNGGWNGDLYVYLVHDSGFAVLLNRVGRDGSNPDGSGSSGMTLSLSDLAGADIHLAAPSTGLLAGSYQPDGRSADPGSVVDSDSRDSMLSSFNGLDGNGSWTLFAADLGAGETATLESWTLTLTGVPEPSAATLALLAGGAALLRRRR